MYGGDVLWDWVVTVFGWVLGRSSLQLQTFRAYSFPKICFNSMCRLASVWWRARCSCTFFRVWTIVHVILITTRACILPTFLENVSNLVLTVGIGSWLAEQLLSSFGCRVSMLVFRAKWFKQLIWLAARTDTLCTAVWSGKCGLWSLLRRWSRRRAPVSPALIICSSRESRHARGGNG